MVQRVERAEVRLGGTPLATIGRGAVVLVAARVGDSSDVADRLADKLVALRYFADADGLTNHSIADIGGELLVISQFTLYADVRRGRRPGFTDAARPDEAMPLLDRFVDRLRSAGITVATGRFGTDMAVELVNDGPFTLILDSAHDLSA